MSAPVWIKLSEWQAARLRPGSRITVNQESIEDDDGYEIGRALAPSKPGVVERIGACWFDQPGGRSGYYVLVRPVEERS